MATKNEHGLTPKQEKFAQKYVELGNATAAYRVAYDKPNASAETITPRASRMFATDKVSTRVKELQAIALEKHKITAERVIEMLLEDREFAQAVEQAGAAVKATELLGKTLGMFTEKIKHEGEIGDKRVHLHMELKRLEEGGVSEEEILRRASDLLREKIRAS